MSDWNTIETAPKNGRTILGWWEKSQTMHLIYWGLESEAWIDDEDANEISAPTHWFEIPQPPGWLPEHH